MYLWVLVVAVKCCSLKLCEQQLIWKCVVFYWLVHSCHACCSILNKWVLLMGQQEVGLDRLTNWPLFSRKSFCVNYPATVIFWLLVTGRFQRLCVCDSVTQCKSTLCVRQDICSGWWATKGPGGAEPSFYPLSSSCNQINNYGSNRLRLRKHAIPSVTPVVQQ